MSTRCNIIIKDEYSKLFFYRHSDGYPEGVRETLGKFMDLLNSGKIRDNVSQAAGWLIMIGADEYDHIRDFSTDNYGKKLNTTICDYVANLKDWKVGSYEPTTGIHGDIEYLYEIDLDKKTLKGWHHNGVRKGGSITVIKETKKVA